MTVSPAPASEPFRSRHHRIPGIACALAASSLFSVNTVFARLTLEGGADTATLNAARFVFTVAVLLAVFALRRRLPRLTQRQRIASLGLGFAFFLSSFGYMGAIQYIQVSEAVLVLYTYPIFVGLVASLAERTSLTPLRLSALILAFVGLALALDIHAAHLPDWRGLVLGLVGALGMTGMVVGSSRTMQGADPSAVNLYLLAGASVLFLLQLLVQGGPVWPQSAGGQHALLGALVTFALAQFALVGAIRYAGSVLAAAVMNMEPVLTVTLAVLIVGESLSARQVTGVALVLVAIVIMSRRLPAPAAGS